jgi:hypothetical protein
VYIFKYIYVCTYMYCLGLKEPSMVYFSKIGIIEEGNMLAHAQGIQTKPCLTHAHHDWTSMFLCPPILLHSTLTPKLRLTHTSDLTLYCEGANMPSPRHVSSPQTSSNIFTVLIQQPKSCISSILESETHYVFK